MLKLKLKLKEDVCYYYDKKNTTNLKPRNKISFTH